MHEAKSTAIVNAISSILNKQFSLSNIQLNVNNAMRKLNHTKCSNLALPPTSKPIYLFPTYVPQIGSYRDTVPQV